MHACKSEECTFTAVPPSTALTAAAPDAPPPAPPAEQPDHAWVLEACRSVMAPLARLAVSRGLQYGQLDGVLRRVLVDAARAVHTDVLAHRSVSRVSATIGLNRREVGRLVRGIDAAVAAARRSPATEAFTRWLSEPQWQRDGRPLPVLPRLGAAPSFETLAASVTKDISARSLLEELCRLGLASVDEASDSVRLMRDRFVPAGDTERLLGFLGANVGDHLAAAAANLQHEAAPPHLEQAVFAAGLSGASVERLQPIVRAQWQSLLKDMVPTLRQFVDDDKAAGRARDHRVRVGIYAYAEAQAPGEPPPAAAPKRRRRKE